MSVFGYGTSYPGRGGSAGGPPQENPQTSPVFSGTPAQPASPSNLTSALPDINFNPNATMPWESEYYDRSQQSNGGFNDAVGSGWKRQASWDNPLLNNFSGWGQYGNPKMGQQPVIPPRPDVTQNWNNAPNEQAWRDRGFGPGWSYSSGAGRPTNTFRGGAPVGPGQVQPDASAKGGGQATVPGYISNFEDLNATIQNASGADLRNLDVSNDYRERFQNTAQDFSNAFANKDFAKDAQTYAGNFNAANTGNWLESAYSQLVERLNDNWLL